MKNRKSILAWRPEALMRKNGTDAGGGKNIIAVLDIGSSKIVAVKIILLNFMSDFLLNFIQC